MKEIKCSICGHVFATGTAKRPMGFKLKLKVQSGERSAEVREHVCSEGCAQTVCARATGAVRDPGPR